jgi:hypothetical protein
VDDAQTDDEEANAHEDLKARSCASKPTWPGEARRSTSENVYRPYMSQYVLACVSASTNAMAATAARTPAGGSMIATGIAAATRAPDAARTRRG